MSVRGILLGLLLVGALLTGPPAQAAPTARTGGWPLPGTPVVLRGFDPPQSRWGAGHRGVDLAARPGQRVLAAAAGRVVFAGQVAGRPVVVIDHGGVRSTYEPVLATVRVGQQVGQGQSIGRLGREEHCADGCLHWGLKRGEQYLDPLTLLAGPADDGVLRLLPGARLAVVRREAAARAAAEAAETTAEVATAWLDPGGSTGPPGQHGFRRPVPGAVTSPYGMRFHPVLHVRKLHDGTDFGAACGTAIRAPYAGKVTGTVASAGYGNRLFLEHGTVDGHRVRTAYNHALRYVARPGQQVHAGQLLGYVGSTGFSTGCHLHLMLWLDGRLVDPMSWL